MLPELSNPPPGEEAKRMSSRQCTHASSQNLFPRFPLKDKYARPASTGVRENREGTGLASCQG